MKDAGDFYDAIPLTRAINDVNLGDLDEARRQVRKALKLNPNASLQYWRSCYIRFRRYR